MGVQQEPKCKLMGSLEFTTTIHRDEGPLICSHRVLQVLGPTSGSKGNMMMIYDFST